MVSAMKSTAEPSLPLIVYGPIRSIHKASHGVVVTILGGRWPNFSCLLLLTWHDLQDLVMDRMVFLIPFQYIAAFIVPSRRSCPGCCRQWWYHIVARRCSGLGITSLPLLQMHFWFSIIRSSSPLSSFALIVKKCLRVLSAFWASTISLTVRG